MLTRISKPFSPRNLRYFVSKQNEYRRQFLSNTKSHEYFNAIDKAHEILEGDWDLAKKVPSCVVVGMQSVGKSAVLSRISGIRFPQDSEVCTRVAIELRLRRAMEPRMAIKAGNFENKEIESPSDDIVVEEALKDAQTKVLNGKDFEDKLSIKVEKEDVDLPEVTLIDLPGVFFAKDDGTDNLEEKVKTMIKERVDNEMALIIHVVPLNQDTDTISTWRIVHDSDEKQTRTISVLTKADLAFESGKDNLKKRIKKIASDSKSAECFVVHGAAKCNRDEESKLAMVANCIEELHLGHSVHVGIPELNKFIENRMLDHIKEKLPEMRKMLEDELHRCKVELGKLGRHPIPPERIALRDLQCIQEFVDKAYEAFQPDLRCFTDDMAQKLFEIDMKPLGKVDVDEANTILNTNWDPNLHDRTENRHHEQHQQDQDQWGAARSAKNIENLNRRVATSIEIRHQEHHILALEVKKVGEDSRAMINVPFVGNEKALEMWLKTFTKPLYEVLEKYIDDLFDAYYDKIVQPSIKDGSSEPTKDLSTKLDALIKRGVILKAKSSAMEYARCLVDSVEENRYTTNDHYLTSTTKDFEESFDKDLEYLSNSYKSTMTPYFHIVYIIRAFFKTRKKVLPDTIQLHFTKALNDLLKATTKEIRDFMMKKSSIDMIKESSRIVKMRRFYIDREKKIEDALEEISLL
jgi:GTP-binding protein EngB required for normal cell division